LVICVRECLSDEKKISKCISSIRYLWSIFLSKIKRKYFFLLVNFKSASLGHHSSTDNGEITKISLYNDRFCRQTEAVRYLMAFIKCQTAYFFLSFSSWTIHIFCIVCHFVRCYLHLSRWKKNEIYSYTFIFLLKYDVKFTAMNESFHILYIFRSNKCNWFFLEQQGEK